MSRRDSMQIRQATAEDLDDILHLAFQVHAIHMALFPHIFKPAVGEEAMSGLSNGVE